MTDATTNADASSAQSLADRAEDARDVFTKRAAEATDQFRSAFNERATQARDWASDQGDVFRDTVQTRPFVAVGVSAGTAFAAGVVLGILLAARR